MTKEKILIVDDDAAVCKVISRVIASKGMEPVVAASGEKALALLDAGPYDLVVLDIKMDDMDGFEVLEQIRGRSLDVPVIILSGNDESYNMLLGLESGADDYMTKPFDPAFLAAKVQALIRRDRKSHQTPSELRVGELRYNPVTMKLLRNDAEIPLSAKEHAILRLFMEHPDRVFSKEELYSLVWQDGRTEEKNDENAVMVYVSRLRGKIEADPRNPRHILTVWGAGYKFADR